MSKRIHLADKLADAVADLIAESDGVEGLHLNGDLAKWDELIAGGRYEEWLSAFDEYQEHRAMDKRQICPHCQGRGTNCQKTDDGLWWCSDMEKFKDGKHFISSWDEKTVIAVWISRDQTEFGDWEGFVATAGTGRPYAACPTLAMPLPQPPNTQEGVE